MKYNDMLEESHYGHPDIVQKVHSGGRGRPRISIDPDFLRWAYQHRTTTGISRFLNVSRDTVRRALVDYGIAERQENPFQCKEPSSSHGASDATTLPAELDDDDFLDPRAPQPNNLPSEFTGSLVLNTTSSTGPLSVLSDDELDDLIARLRSHYTRVGLSMIDGMLRRLGYRVPRQRIRESLMRVDPVQRVFQRIKIRRRKYSVPGPMALWHHDGQHGESCSFFFSFN